ncbi:MAG: L-threonylcarbamoyladenylate synthase [PVC group bacterium]
MNTRFIHLNHREKEPEALFEAGRILAEGGVILFPTETVYGLGGDGNNPAVVKRIYRIKKRSGNKPLVRLIADREKIRSLPAEEGQRRLLEEFWPGPLTVILRTPEGIHQGYRLPGHDFLRRLIEESGVALVATSANLSGEPAIIDGAAARRLFSGKVDLIIDGGEVAGAASTVLDLTASPERILREGPVTREEIEACLGHRVATGR